MFERIRADIKRKQDHYVLVNRAFNKYVKISLQFGTLAVVVYRIGNWCLHRSRLLRWPLMFFYHLIRIPSDWLSRTYLDPRTEIGSGFVIHNFSSIVINARSIGENLTINQGVFVGPDWRNNGLPKIGNNVFLGSGAKVLGDVKVGNNVVVAANSVITRSIEDDCMVAGVPGMVIKRGLDADYVGNVPAHSR